MRPPKTTSSHSSSHLDSGNHCGYVVWMLVTDRRWLTCDKEEIIKSGLPQLNEHDCQRHWRLKCVLCYISNQAPQPAVSHPPGGEQGGRSHVRPAAAESESSVCSGLWWWYMTPEESADWIRRRGASPSHDHHPLSPSFWDSRQVMLTKNKARSVLKLCMRRIAKPPTCSTTQNTFTLAGMQPNMEVKAVLCVDWTLSKKCWYYFFYIFLLGDALWGGPVWCEGVCFSQDVAQDWKWKHW